MGIRIPGFLMPDACLMVHASWLKAPREAIENHQTLVNFGSLLGKWKLISFTKSKKASRNNLKKQENTQSTIHCTCLKHQDFTTSKNSQLEAWGPLRGPMVARLLNQDDPKSQALRPHEPSHPRHNAHRPPRHLTTHTPITHLRF